MDALSEDDLRAVERKIAQRMVTEFGLDLSALVLDMTNFATLIDSANPKAPIAQRGKAKQKRTGLRLVGLALVVTRDGGIPLVSHAYPGDRPDVTQFPEVIDELVARYRQLADSLESLTVVSTPGRARPPIRPISKPAGWGSSARWSSRTTPTCSPSPPPSSASSMSTGSAGSPPMTPPPPRWA